MEIDITALALEAFRTPVGGAEVATQVCRCGTPGTIGYCGSCAQRRAVADAIGGGFNSGLIAPVPLCGPLQ